MDAYPSFKQLFVITIIYSTLLKLTIKTQGEYTIPTIHTNINKKSN